MNFNATLIGQSITFIFFVWFCMKFVWPPIMNALETRKKQIADGLAAADRGKHELELAAKKAGDNMRDAKAQAAEVIAQAEKRAAQIIEEAKVAAKEEGDRQLAAAQANIAQETNRARESLREQVAGLAVAGAEKILRREVNAQTHADLLGQLKAEL
ncbi:MULTISPECIES: F0F1 ATP synthase subunit B [unclassified Thiobacillus]|uniref:F0F1 ATP synthase subunit B n=1 Tax=unclassified Thiobacillus TaxID=2646513 RepID=UPI00086F6257|nr:MULTISPECIES: F0F1 ATP synthase subunit B [unclassified Thiobacillus]MBD3810926.1 F0F1 ATP synthase subunit B [Betaproteobacteria bacterium]MBS0312421.1 F0F1 ATP synthase subunit B [Pseudomonadota bacterium]ODU05671.1 MAG: F0F1 ATP synthase subunit B [Thiobacillus sp. SCN 63-1177]OGU48982.1 MAG: F0F1 ATP synthase subunit B [Hydrogenophilales bacterium RIFOXYA1_FULL_63_33]MBC2729935.1 F0F1 ATP synthase subunit B [Thiobacillus sp.]